MNLSFVFIVLISLGTFLEASLASTINVPPIQSRDGVITFFSGTWYVNGSAYIPGDVKILNDNLHIAGNLTIDNKEGQIHPQLTIASHVTIRVMGDIVIYSGLRFINPSTKRPVFDGNGRIEWPEKITVSYSSPFISMRNAYLSCTRRSIAPEKVDAMADNFKMEVQQLNTTYPYCLFSNENQETILGIVLRLKLINPESEELIIAIVFGVVVFCCISTSAICLFSICLYHTDWYSYIRAKFRGYQQPGKVIFI